jgi:hypothetical protein
MANKKKTISQSLTIPKRPRCPTAPVKEFTRDMIVATIEGTLSIKRLIEIIPKNVNYKDVWIEIDQEYDYDAAYVYVYIKYKQTIPNPNYNEQLSKYKTKQKTYKLKLEKYKKEKEIYDKYIRELQIKDLEKKLTEAKKKLKD